MKKPSPLLSKSRFLSGLQCPLRLWHQCYNRDLAAPITPSQQALFDMGHRVGRIATERYPQGVLIAEDYTRHESAVESTLKAMADPAVSALFEAAFTEDGVRVRADILGRRPEGRWNLAEVKSSTTVKDEYFTDLAVQLHVLKRAGLEIEQVCLMHINRDYVYDGKKLDLACFLTLEDLTENAVLLQDFVQENLDRLKTMLSLDSPPAIQPSRHCKQPHTCEFWDHCTRNMPENWIFELAGISQDKFQRLSEDGVDRIDEIPDDFSLTAMQKRVRSCVINSADYVSDNLEDALTDAVYPLHFLDFETIGPAIPRYKGTRPYQTIPFQWSDHILHPDGTLEHTEFICEDGRDPRPDFTATMLDVLGQIGTIFIYTTYEQGIIRELARDFPEYSAELEDLHARFLDLCDVIRKNFYTAAFHGSFSLKYVLPAIVPNMSYENLAIQEGNAASLEYLRMIDPGTTTAEKKTIKSNLLAYCGQDTLAMVKIREALLDIFNTIF